MKQTIARLNLRPFIWTHDGPISRPNAPASGYFVDGMPNDLIVQITNKRAHDREPLWQFRYVGFDAELGEYKTEQDALSVLQSFLDDPTELLEACHQAEAEWLQRWGAIPEHFFAKREYRDVESWKRIVEAHGLKY
jgi:hypothetical protein